MFTGSTVPETVISSELAEKTHSLLSGIVNGVYSMSEEIEGLVESSSNLGILRLSPDGLFVRCYERSSSSEKTDEILAVFKKAVEENGLTESHSFPQTGQHGFRKFTVSLYYG